MFVNGPVGAMKLKFRTALGAFGRREELFPSPIVRVVSICALRP